MIAPIEDATWLDSIVDVTWTELVSASGLPESELVELVRFGALVPLDPRGHDLDVRGPLAGGREEGLAHSPRFRARSARRQRRPELCRADRASRGGNPRASRAKLG